MDVNSVRNTVNEFITKDLIKENLYYKFKKMLKIKI